MPKILLRHRQKPMFRLGAVGTGTNLNLTGPKTLQYINQKIFNRDETHPGSHVSTALGAVYMEGGRS